MHFSRLETEGLQQRGENHWTGGGVTWRRWRRGLTRRVEGVYSCVGPEPGMKTPVKKRKVMDRRDFLKNTAGAGVAAWTAVSASRVLGANDRLNVGLIGCGGRGTFDARLMRGTPEDIQAVANENYHDGNLDPRLKEPRNVDIMALCDCYGSKIDAAKKWAPQAKTYDDFRKLLADKTVDAVIIATHDPWHAQMLIMACEAGKDVYLEKPVIYRVGEAQAMIDAVRKSKRIVQCGTQHRSAEIGRASCRERG